MPTQGLVSITVKRASMGHDRLDPYRQAGPGSPEGSASEAATPGACCPAFRRISLTIKSSYPKTSHTISSEQSQLHLRLLKTHFPQTAVK